MKSEIGSLKMSTFLGAASIVTSLMIGSFAGAATISVGGGALSQIMVLGQGYDPVSGARGNCLVNDDVNSIQLVQPSVRYNIRTMPVDSEYSRVVGEIVVVHTVQAPLNQKADAGYRLDDFQFQQRCGTQLVDVVHIGGRFIFSILAKIDEVKQVPNIQIIEQSGGASQAKTFASLFTNLTSNIKATGSSMSFNGTFAPVGNTLGESVESFRSNAIKSRMMNIVEVETRNYTAEEKRTIMSGKKN